MTIKDKLYVFIRNTNHITYDEVLEWARQHGTVRVRKNRKSLVEINFSENKGWHEVNQWADNHELMLLDLLETNLRRCEECLGKLQLSELMTLRNCSKFSISETGEWASALSAYRKAFIDIINNFDKFREIYKNPETQKLSNKPNENFDQVTKEMFDAILKETK